VGAFSRNARANSPKCADASRKTRNRKYPKPLTLLHWIEQESGITQTTESAEALRVLHPDPPLGPEERDVLSRLAKMSKLGRDIDIMTPRLLAARGG